MNFKELEMVRLKNAGFDTAGINVEDYTYSQLIELTMGIQKGFDISKFNDPELTAYQMHFIREALSLSKSLDNVKEYDDMQLKEILEGLYEGVDVIKFITPEFNAEQIGYLVQSIVLGLDTESLAKPEHDEVLLELICQYPKYIDSFLDLFKEGYRGDQIYEIFTGSKKGVNVLPYITPDASVGEIIILNNALMLGVDVSELPIADLNEGQLRILIDLASDGFDIRDLAKPEYSEDEMYIFGNVYAYMRNNGIKDLLEGYTEYYGAVNSDIFD